MPSGAMKAGPQKVAFQVTSNSEAHVSAVYSIFGNRDLPSTSQWVTKGNSNRLYVFVISWTALTNDSKESVSCLILGFLLGYLLLLDGAPSSKVRKVH